MTELLIKLFVKDRKNLSDPRVRARYGSFASIVGIILNILISALKLVIGLLSSTISVTADGVNNLADAGASIISLISFKLSVKPADKDHPFGHARIEYVASMIVSFLILLVGTELLMDSVSSLFSGDTGGGELGTVGFSVLMISVLAKLWFAVFCKKISKRIGSATIKAAGTDALADAVSTSAVLVSAVIMLLTGFAFLDSIMGIAVSIIIIIAGIKILIETKNSILGESPSGEIVENIRKIAAEYPEIIGIHDMIVHNYGPGHYIASFHAEVDGSDDIFKLHDTVDLVEKRIFDELSILCSIHMDPIDTNDETVAKLKGIAEEAISCIYPNVSIHDFRVVTGQTHTNMIFDIVIPFDEKEQPNKIVDAISSEVKKKDPNLYCVITVDRE